MRGCMTQKGAQPDVTHLSLYTLPAFVVSTPPRVVLFAPSSALLLLLCVFVCVRPTLLSVRGNLASAGFPYISLRIPTFARICPL